MDKSYSILPASDRGDTETVRTLLKQYPKAVHLLNYENNTALILAARGGHIDTVRALLEAGADVHYADQGRWTALSYASRWGHNETIDVLREYGA